MTAPIDLPCPTCHASAGRACLENVRLTETHAVSRTLTFHHGARVDAAARELARSQQSDPAHLRIILREVIDAWKRYAEACHDTEDLRRIAEIEKELAL